jgi:hypothetical protein
LEPEKTLEKEDKKKKERQEILTSSLNSDQRELEGLSKNDTVVGVLDTLELGDDRALGVDPLPVDNSGGNLVKDLEQDQAVLEVLENVVDEGLNVERVHPIVNRNEKRKALAEGIRQDAELIDPKLTTTLERNGGEEGNNKRKGIARTG